MSGKERKLESLSPEEREIQSVVDRVMEAGDRLSTWNSESIRTGHGSLSFGRSSHEPNELLRVIMRGASRYQVIKPKATAPEPKEVIGTVTLEDAKSQVINIADRLGIGGTVSDDYTDTMAPNLGRTIRLAESMGAVVHITVEVTHPGLDIVE